MANNKYALLMCFFLIAIFSFPGPYVMGHDLSSDDLSDYITPYDSMVVELAESIGMKPFLSYPLENAGTAYYWVSENIRYQYDNQTWGERARYGDYWQLPSTTLKLRTGDCEDQALLLASLLRALRLPRENVRVAVSYTHHHAWVEIKIPIPVYGLEKVAASSLELLAGKKVNVSIGEFSLIQEIPRNKIDEIKAAGLSHNNGWIPLDTTAKIFGLPMPFSWWLTYGYNVYILFYGSKMTPERTFQDKARIWEESKEIGTGGSLSFEIPCVVGDQILGVVKARNAWKERVLASVSRVDVKVAGWGPFYLNSGEKLKVELVSDRDISIYVLTETQYRSWAPYGIEWVVVAPGVGYCGTTSQGSVEHIAKYSDNFYVVLWVYPFGWGGAAARIYDAKVKKIYQETACDVEVSVIDPQGTSIISVSIVQREVEKRFDFTAEKNGIYKVVLRNVGVSAPIYVRLEEFSTPLGPVAGVSESLVLAEQNYVVRIAKATEENTSNNGSWFSDGLQLKIIIFSTTSIILMATIILIWKKKGKFGFLK